MKLLLTLLLTLLPFSALPAAGHQRQHFSYTADSTDCRHMQQDDTISASVITAEYLRHRGRDIIISMKGNPMAEGAYADIYISLFGGSVDLEAGIRYEHSVVHAGGTGPSCTASSLLSIPKAERSAVRAASRFSRPGHTKSPSHRFWATGIPSEYPGSGTGTWNMSR